MSQMPPRQRMFVPPDTDTGKFRFGRILDEAIDDYHKHPAISKTKIDIFRQSPKLFYKRFVTGEIPPDPPTEALIVGQAVDNLVLEGREEFEKRFVLIPENAPSRPSTRTLNAKKRTPQSQANVDWWAEFQEKHKGKQTITGEQMETVEACVRSLEQHDTFQSLIRGGVSQHSFRLAGSHYAIQCRPDRFVEDGNEASKGEPIILDLKTIQELPADQPDHISRHICDWGYHRGSYLYPEIVSTVMKWKDFRPRFVFAFVEKQEPFAVRCVEIDRSAKEIAEREVRGSLHQLKECFEKSIWPFHWEQELTEVELPGYYVRRTADLEGGLWG